MVILHFQLCIEAGKSEYLRGDYSSVKTRNKFMFPRGHFLIWLKIITYFLKGKDQANIIQTPGGIFHFWKFYQNGHSVITFVQHIQFLSKLDELKCFPSLRI